MIHEYYTTVKASDDFWKQLVSKATEEKHPIGFIGENVAFTITTKYGPAIRTLIELSNRFPKEIFEATITTNDLYNNLIEYYEFRSGTTSLNHLEPIYHFVCSEETKQKVDPIIVNQFKEEIIEALNRLSYFEPSTERKINQPSNEKKERISNICFEYGRRRKLLTATVMGTTYIKINSDAYSEELDSLPV